VSRLGSGMHEIADVASGRRQEERSRRWTATSSSWREDFGRGVSCTGNAALDHAVAAPHAVIAFYAATGGDTLQLPVRELMFANLRWQGVLVYTVPPAAKAHAVEDVSAAVADGALRAGAEAGLPLHRFPLDRTADAHSAVQNNAVGKVIVEVATD
jgi:NADPH:quinone reductase